MNHDWSRDAVVAITVVLIGIAAIAIPRYFLRPPHPVGFWHVLFAILVWDVLPDVGIAFFVSVVLMLTLDRSSRRKIQIDVGSYIREVGDHTLRAVYGREIPQKAFDTIHDSLLKEQFVRTAYRMTIRMKRFGVGSLQDLPTTAQETVASYLNEHKSNDLILFRYDVFSRTKNISGTTATHTVPFQIAKPLAVRYSGLSGVTSMIIDGDEKLDAPVLSMQKSEGDPAVLLCSREVDILAGAEADVTVRSYEVRWDRGEESWHTFKPCSGMQITVDVEDGSLDVVIALDAPTPEGQTRYVELDPNTNTATLAVTDYLLPYQGCTVHWAPRLEPVPAAEPTKSGAQRAATGS